MGFCSSRGIQRLQWGKTVSQKPLGHISSFLKGPDGNIAFIQSSAEKERFVLKPNRMDRIYIFGD